MTAAKTKAADTATPQPDPAAPQAQAAQSAQVELESDTGGWFVNHGQVDLMLLQPATRLKPGRVIELESDPGHRDLRRATDAEIQAARDAEAAEQAAAAALAAETGQEQ